MGLGPNWAQAQAPWGPAKEHFRYVPNSTGQHDDQPTIKCTLPSEGYTEMDWSPARQGPKPDPGVQKRSLGLNIPKLHTEKHAESSGRHFKQSHMLQVTALNNPWPTTLSGTSYDDLRRPEFEDLAGSRPKHFCGVEPIPLLAKTCSTPGLRPGLRPRQKCLGRIPGLGHGIEQFSAVPKAWSTLAKMPRSSRNLQWLNSARPPGRF